MKFYSCEDIRNFSENYKEEFQNQFLNKCILGGEEEEQAEPLVSQLQNKLWRKNNPKKPAAYLNLKPQEDKKTKPEKIQGEKISSPNDIKENILFYDPESLSSTNAANEAEQLYKEKNKAFKGDLHINEFINVNINQSQSQSLTTNSVNVNLSNISNKEKFNKFNTEVQEQKNDNYLFNLFQTPNQSYGFYSANNSPWKSPRSYSDSFSLNNSYNFSNSNFEEQQGNYVSFESNIFNTNNLYKFHTPGSSPNRTQLHQDFSKQSPKKLNLHLQKPKTSSLFVNYEKDDKIGRAHV